MSLEQQLAENTAAILALTAALQGLSTLPTASTPVVQQQAKKSETAAPAPAPAEAAAQTTSSQAAPTETTTFDALKKDFLSLSTKVKDAAGNAFGGRAACEELLAKFGAAKLSNLVETQWAEAHAFVKDKLAV